MALGENFATGAVGALESVEAVDGAALKLAGAVTNAIPVGAPRDALSGTWLSHALHPALTDVVIGSFFSATLLDLLGGDDTGRASERLIEIGLVTSAPTVASGLSDWALTVYGDRRTRPVGLAHASVNLSASTLYAASLAARRRGAPGRGKLLGVASGTLLSVGAFLGGHLSFTRGVGVSQTTFDEGPHDWTTVEAGALEDGRPTSAMAGDTPVLLLRHNGHLHALHDRCSHRGCLLSSGEVEGESITCPCHGSRFDLRNGSIERGPATAPKPVFETRDHEGAIGVVDRQIGAGDLTPVRKGHDHIEHVPRPGRPVRGILREPGAALQQNGPTTRGCERVELRVAHSPHPVGMQPARRDRRPR